MADGEQINPKHVAYNAQHGNGLTGNGLQELVNELTSRLSTYHTSHGSDTDEDEEEEGLPEVDPAHRDRDPAIILSQRLHQRRDIVNGSVSGGQGEPEEEAGFAQTRSESSTMKESKTFPFGIKRFADDSSIHGE